MEEELNYFYENFHRLQKINKLIKIITKYKNPMIMISNNNNLEFSGKPNGLWISYGYNWIKYRFDDTKYDFYSGFFHKDNDHIYKIELLNKNILYINNLDEFYEFLKKFLYSNEDKKINLNWIEIKKLYDGLIIYPKLYSDIHKMLRLKKIHIKHIGSNKLLSKYFNTNIKNKSTINLALNEGFEKQYIKDGLKSGLNEDTIKYINFYLNYFEYWREFNGVIWNKKSIKNIKLLI